MKPPASLTASERQTFLAGALVVGQSGCLACHKIGENGNDGPGPNLSHIGHNVLPGGIASTLRNPTRADAVVQEPAAEEVRRPRRVLVTAAVVAAPAL